MYIPKPYVHIFNFTPVNIVTYVIHSKLFTDKLDVSQQKSPFSLTNDCYC